MLTSSSSRSKHLRLRLLLGYSYFCFIRGSFIHLLGQNDLVREHLPGNDFIIERTCFLRITNSLMEGFNLSIC